MRFLREWTSKVGLAAPYLEIWPQTTTPRRVAHIRPTAEPAATGAKGDLYFDSTANCLMQHNGSAWEQVGSSPSGDLTLGGDLSVGDDLTLASDGAILTMGASNPVVLTHSANTLTLASGDTLAVTSAATIGTTLDVTGATTLGGAVNYKRQVTDTGGVYATPIALTEAQSGRVILVDDAAGLDFTLPALAAAQIGTHYKFLVTVTITSNNFRVTAQAGDLLNGGVLMVDFDDVYTAPQAVFLEPDFSDDLVFTANGSTTGGKKGTVVEFIAVSATQWFVTGIVAGDGVLATPFS